MNFATRGQVSRARRLVNEAMRHFPGVERAVVEPSVAIIIRMMDRSDDLRRSLPSLLNQDYPRYFVCIVDVCSRDGLDSVLKEFQCERLKLIHCPRPSYFAPSHTHNTGARYTFSDLLFFLDADTTFKDEGHLSRIVAQFLYDKRADHHWFSRWRASCGYEPVTAGTAIITRTRYRRVYCHCLGLPLLVDRQTFQGVGGFDERLQDWGYEDTDLLARLELAGFGHIEMETLIQCEHDDALRVANYREKDRQVSWHRNRRRSDESIGKYGIPRSQRFPGRCEWIEIDSVRWDGSIAPQQDWELPSVL
jgi:GT2 family glycosyltransferase